MKMQIDSDATHSSKNNEGVDQSRNLNSVAAPINKNSKSTDVITEEIDSVADDKCSKSIGIIEDASNNVADEEFAEDSNHVINNED